MSAAPCRDGSGTHLFTIGADRCSICGWIRWPEVVDDAPMTAPEATPGRVPPGIIDDAWLNTRLWWPAAKLLALAGIACSVVDPESPHDLCPIVVGKRHDSAIILRRGTGKHWRLTVTPGCVTP